MALVQIYENLWEKLTVKFSDQELTEAGADLGFLLAQLITQVYISVHSSGSLKCGTC